eukprot:5824851-Prymnesium_polylepis.1
MANGTLALWPGSVLLRTTDKTSDPSTSAGWIRVPCRSVRSRSHPRASPRPCRARSSVLYVERCSLRPKPTLLMYACRPAMLTSDWQRPSSPCTSRCRHPACSAQSSLPRKCVSEIS